MPAREFVSTGWEEISPTFSRYARMTRKKTCKKIAGRRSRFISRRLFPAEESHEESGQVGAGGRSGVGARCICATEWSAGGRRAAGNGEWLLQGAGPHRE